MNFSNQFFLIQHVSEMNLLINDKQDRRERGGGWSG